MKPLNCDLAIVGSGFGGSLLAMIVRRLGRSVVMLERGRHPRFAIGESSTPLANLLLAELARRYDLPRLLPLCKWGSWQKTHPGIGCGLKRGFTFYQHEFDQPFQNDPERRNELLVAASPRDEVGDTHWYRPDFDHFLVREAVAAGVEYLDEVKLSGLSEGGEGIELHGQRAGEPLSVRARFVVDASGPRGFLHRALSLPEASFEHLPATQALYTHFNGVGRIERVIGCDGMTLSESGRPGVEAPPYPVDAAALHHVFDGGWIWVLHFNNGLTSAGVAMTDALAQTMRLSEGEPAWRRLLARLPTVQEQFAGAQAVLPFVHAPRLPFRSRVVTGRRWAMLPSAAGVVDPLLSTGFPLTLWGITRLAAALAEDWGAAGSEPRLAAYGRQTLEELDATARLVGALYATMRDFELFAALTLLYFAAAIYSESARRLNRPELAASFLLFDDPQFGAALRECCDRARQPLLPAQRRRLIEAIYRAIEPIDVAGLGRRKRRNWHPVLDEDLAAAARKMGIPLPADPVLRLA
jgi:FADH2 O2-dependent halogenase